jgi:thiamine biosynthesis lipoprotein
VQTFEITDGAITTSGTYEHAAHTSDPYTGIIAIGPALATVVDPSGWLCDGLETALIVVGKGGATYFSQPELVGYQVFVIGRHENSARSI